VQRSGDRNTCPGRASATANSEQLRSKSAQHQGRPGITATPASLQTRSIPSERSGREAVLVSRAWMAVRFVAFAAAGPNQRWVGDTTELRDSGSVVRNPCGVGRRRSRARPFPLPLRREVPQNRARPTASSPLSKGSVAVGRAEASTFGVDVLACPRCSRRLRLGALVCLNCPPPNSRCPGGA
jgi:hypothetical protein